MALLPHRGTSPLGSYCDANRHLPFQQAASLQHSAKLSGHYHRMIQTQNGLSWKGAQRSSFTLLLSFPFQEKERPLIYCTKVHHMHHCYFLLAGTINGRYCCPQLYINHRCFSGPYLNKGRIAELPQSVGPGKCVLVLKEVRDSYFGGKFEGEAWVVGCWVQNLIRDT